MTPEIRYVWLNSHEYSFYLEQIFEKRFLLFSVMEEIKISTLSSPLCLMEPMRLIELNFKVTGRLWLPKRLATLMSLNFCCKWGKEKNQNLREVHPRDSTLTSHLKGRGYLHDHVPKIHQVVGNIEKVGPTNSLWVLAMLLSSCHCQLSGAAGL